MKIVRNLMKRNRTSFLFSIIVLVGLVTLTACGNSQSDDLGSGTVEEDGKLTGTITMAGSTSVQPLSEELAAEFMKKHPDVRLEVAGGGSGGGVRAAQEGAADFGAAARELKSDETGIEAFTIAIDGIAVIVNPENPINDLPFEDVKKIFTGEITNWSELGGENGNIVVVNREEGSGTRGAFHEILLGEDDFISTAIIQNSTGAVREAVSNDINAIGYVSLGGLNESVQGIKVSGAEPTVEKILAGEYPISRPFNYLVKEGAALNEVAQGFIDFVLSDAGQRIVEENGFVPVK